MARVARLRRRKEARIGFLDDATAWCAPYFDERRTSVA
jgi:hypothetical protein